MDECIFCKIIKGELPSFKIYEDDDFFAVLDISQFTEGHTIVIPKEHVASVWEVKKSKEYWALVSKIAKHYKNLGFEYVDSSSWGRMIKHGHVHLVPHNGEENDWRKALKEVGDMQHDPTRRPSKEKGEEIAKKFRL